MWIHELVFIRYVENDNSLIFECLPVLFLDFVSMRPLHHEDEVRPLDQFVAQSILCIVVRSRRQGVDTLNVSKDVISRWTAKPILTAHEQIVALTQ